MEANIDLMQELRERRTAFSEVTKKPKEKPESGEEKKDKPSPAQSQKPKVKAINFGEKLAPSPMSYAPYRNVKGRCRMSVTLSKENKTFIEKLSKAKDGPINQTLNEILDEYRYLYREGTGT